jgi:hypothetical protein
MVWFLSIFAKHKWGGGPLPKEVVEGYSTSRLYPSVTRFARATSPFALRENGEGHFGA